MCKTGAAHKIAKYCCSDESNCVIFRKRADNFAVGELNDIVLIRGFVSRYNLQHS